MKIGILEAGMLREEMATRFDPYPVMFKNLIALAGHEFEFTTVSVLRGQMPSSVFDCDAWLITGSRHGVYDNLAWMVPLQEFIRDLANTEIPLIGVCFGHQIIAQALGGEVVKSDRGWGVGLHYYQIDRPQNWMPDQLKRIGIYAFHQDQVVTCPPAAQVFSSSEFCPYAGLSYGNSIISLQAHPEFREDYETALLDAYGGSLLPAEVAAAARATMASGNTADTEQLAHWFANFLLSHKALPAASHA